MRKSAVRSLNVSFDDCGDVTCCVTCLIGSALTFHQVGPRKRVWSTHFATAIDQLCRVMSGPCAPCCTRLAAKPHQLLREVFATNGVGRGWTFSLPHLGQAGRAVECSFTCSACSNFSPHCSQRYS